MLRRAFEERPLATVLVLAAVLRVTAAIFSKGFFAVDDHFVLVDAADRLLRGPGLEAAHMRSVLYPSVVVLLMRGAAVIDDPSPATLMLVVRLAQAVYSLLAVVLVYRILERRAGARAALVGGLLAAAYFVLPVTSVHQFEEVVCQVPLLASCWWVLRAHEARRGGGFAVAAGMALGVALVLRFPLITFVAPFALLVLVWELRDQRGVLFAAGFALVLIAQGFSNLVVNHEWGYSFRAYYGQLFHWPLQILTPQGSYPRGTWWTYLAVLVAAFVPPFSLVLLVAAVRGGKAWPLVGVPTLTFLVALSVIANRQERFIVPVLPLVLVLAALGFEEVGRWFAARGWKSAYRALWIWFWVVNIPLTVGLAFEYGKRDRVAPLVYVEARHDATGVVVAQYTTPFFVPSFYLGWPRPPLYVLEDRRRLAQDATAIRAAAPPPNYLILYSDSLAADEALLAQSLGVRLRREAVVLPSVGDELAHLVNPRRNNSSAAVVLSLEPGTTTAPRVGPAPAPR